MLSVVTTPSNYKRMSQLYVIYMYLDVF
jgi:hypothetical protein